MKSTFVEGKTRSRREALRSFEQPLYATQNYIFDFDPTRLLTMFLEKKVQTQAYSPAK